MRNDDIKCIIYKYMLMNEREKLFASTCNYYMNSSVYVKTFYKNMFFIYNISLFSNSL